MTHNFATKEEETIRWICFVLFVERILSSSPSFARGRAFDPGAGTRAMKTQRTAHRKSKTRRSASRVRRKKGETSSRSNIFNDVLEHNLSLDFWILAVTRSLSGHSVRHRHPFPWNSSDLFVCFGDAKKLNVRWKLEETLKSWTQFISRTHLCITSPISHVQMGRGSIRWLGRPSATMSTSVIPVSNMATQPLPVSVPQLPPRRESSPRFSSTNPSASPFTNWGRPSLVCAP